jgi:site-specific recombinase XerD
VRRIWVVAADPITVSPDEQLCGVVDHFLQAQLAPRTPEAYAGDLASFLGWCRARGLHPLRAARPDIDRYRNWLAELIGPDGRPAANGRPRYAAATVARKLSAVRAFYAYLVDRQLVPGSPASGVKAPRVRREPRGRAITQDHIRALLAAAAQDPQSEAIVCLLLLNGLRVSEVCRADIEDLRREPGGGHSLVVRGKGG